VGHFEEQGIINKRCRYPIACLSNRTQRQLQFYFLSNCNCSPVIVKEIEFWVFIAILGLEYRTIRRCLQNVFCEEPAARNWIGSHHWSVAQSQWFTYGNRLIYCLCFGVSLAVWLFLYTVYRIYTIRSECIYCELWTMIYSATPL
jgi:hypothetical protein